MTDISITLSEQIQDACSSQQPLSIIGNSSKSFYGNITHGQPLEISSHTGIINYEPTELVITARAGTSLDEINQALTEHHQMLGFEPSTFNNASLGGTVACNSSGPRRPYAGAARDFVLGCRIINGKGEILHFGGEVMKNVAGYDVSRLMTGAMGTLGVLLDISIKVLPKPEDEITFHLEIPEQQALDMLTRLRSKPVPVTASCHDDSGLYIRLSGSSSAIHAAQKNTGGDIIKESKTFWEDIREHQHDFFNNSEPLWRLSMPPATNIHLEGQTFIEWGGAQRWLTGQTDNIHIRDTMEKIGGHATLYKNGNKRDDCFHPLDNNMFKIQQQLKKAFDPENILNPGKMYKGL
ncbi:MAG: glycolate oxidase subunit GlcE [Gammaproteobacteria bacterium]|nr:glycolate oxidase subunit GlcE [Gammaproteobacteria bacterium]